jgi:hypothetical protein
MSGNTFQLAETKGGAAIDILDAGSTTQTYRKLPLALIHWN